MEVSARDRRQPVVKRTPAKIVFTKIQDEHVNDLVRMYVHIRGVKHTIEITPENFTMALFGVIDTPCTLVEVERAS
jgi:hypothetical protein